LVSVRLIITLEVARYNLGCYDAESGNINRAIKHWTIAASGGEYRAMHQLRTLFETGRFSRESFELTLAAYNNSCAEMRSDAKPEMLSLEIYHPLLRWDQLTQLWQPATNIEMLILC
jgi:hypothetical protein